MGIDILSIPLGIAVWGKFVSLCNNLRKLDALYFGLVRNLCIDIKCILTKFY